MPATKVNGHVHHSREAERQRASPVFRLLKQLGSACRALVDFCALCFISSDRLIS